MRHDRVPQDGSRTYAGERKAVYALDDQGRYVRTVTSGWTAEETATAIALEEYRRLAAEARERVQAGELAPLAYHMYSLRMEPETLAQAAGLFRWRVRRHLRPAVWERLPRRVLERYAAAMGLSVTALQQLPESETSTP